MNFLVIENNIAVNFFICVFSINRNGPEWNRLRQALQRPLNMMENIRQYIPGIDNISSEFAEQIAISIKKNKTSPDFVEDLSKVFLECTIS